MLFVYTEMLTSAKIENELNGQWKNIATKTPNPSIDGYMQELEDVARASGIDVPLTHNAPNMVRSHNRPQAGLSILSTHS